ncbi:ribonuclease H-like domain-containing protein [Tanacetum coccineum]
MTRMVKMLFLKERTRLPCSVDAHDAEDDDGLDDKDAENDNDKDEDEDDDPFFVAAITQHNFKGSFLVDHMVQSLVMVSLLLQFRVTRFQFILMRSVASIVNCIKGFVNFVHYAQTMDGICCMSLHGYSDHEYEADDDHPTLISKLDLSSSLHLHPNDFATLTVISVKLKGTENYQVWSCSMLLALEGKNKNGFIDGSCRRSNTDEETYDKVDGSVTFSLHHKINSLSQNGSSIADYYHRLNAMWKQFDALVQLPRCTCHAAEDFKKHNQLMKLMQFLMGLDDCYMQIKSNILSRDELSYVRCVYAIISSTDNANIIRKRSNRTNTDTGTDRVQKSQKIAINGQHSQSLVNIGQSQEDKTLENTQNTLNVN